MYPEQYEKEGCPVRHFLPQYGNGRAFLIHLKESLGLVVLCICVSGCGTAISQYVGHQEDSKIVCESREEYERETCGIGQPNVYSGVSFDTRLLLTPFICESRGEGDMIYGYIYPVVAPVLIIDLPLSLATDTVILPYTIYRQFKYGSMIELKEK